MSDVHNVNVNLLNGTLAVGTTMVFGFFAPTASIGGGITITKVDFISSAAIAAASAPVYTLVTTDSACLPNGTITSVLASANWTAGTARVGTIESAFVDATYGVAIKAVGPVAGQNATTHCVVAAIQYVMGR